MRYYTGTACPEAEAMGLGLIKGPASYNPATAARYDAIILDNSCYSQQILPGTIYADRWRRFLDRMEPIADRVTFAVVPDLADHERAQGPRHPAPAEATCALFDTFHDDVAGRFPVAYALQPGAELGLVPWDRIDAVFVGGDTDWKLSHHALYLCAEAKSRGLLTHLGRANGARRMMRAQSMQVDSCDGNLLAYAPTKNAARLGRILARLPRTPQLALA